jgi:hypothetical protein
MASFGLLLRRGRGMSSFDGLYGLMIMCFFGV